MVYTALMQLIADEFVEFQKTVKTMLIGKLEGKFCTYVGIMHVVNELVLEVKVVVTIFQMLGIIGEV